MSKSNLGYCNLVMYCMSRNWVIFLFSLPASFFAFTMGVVLIDPTASSSNFLSDKCFKLQIKILCVLKDKLNEIESLNVSTNWTTITYHHIRRFCCNNCSEETNYQMQMIWRSKFLLPFLCRLNFGLVTSPMFRIQVDVDIITFFAMIVMKTIFVW